MRKLTNNVIRTISKSGLCSRKQALGLVIDGRVKIKGKTVLDPGTIVSDPGDISVDDKPLAKPKKRYILFHKPAGYVTTRSDELGRPTVYEFFKDIDDWVFPVGRLDLDSEGLLIFTNDTKFGNILTDPLYNIERIYEVFVDGPVSEDEMQSMLKGVDIGRGEITRPTRVKILDKINRYSRVEISLKGGKNREIRRLFECLDKPVKRLIRTKYGPFSLGSIKPGKWIELKEVPSEFA